MKVNRAVVALLFALACFAAEVASADIPPYEPPPVEPPPPIEQPQPSSDAQRAEELGRAVGFACGLGGCCALQLAGVVTVIVLAVRAQKKRRSAP